MVNMIMKYPNVGGVIVKLMPSRATNAIAEFVIDADNEDNYAHATMNLGTMWDTLTILSGNPLPMKAVIVDIRPTMLQVMGTCQRLFPKTIKRTLI